MGTHQSLGAGGEGSAAGDRLSTNPVIGLGSDQSPPDRMASMILDLVRWEYLDVGGWMECESPCCYLSTSVSARPNLLYHHRCLDTANIVYDEHIEWDQ